MLHLKLLFVIIAQLVAFSIQARTSWESFCVKSDQTVEIWSNNCHQTKVCYKGKVSQFDKKKNVTSKECNKGTWNVIWQSASGRKNYLWYGGVEYLAKNDDPMAKKYGYAYCNSAFVSQANIVC